MLQGHRIIILAAAAMLACAGLARQESAGGDAKAKLDRAGDPLPAGAINRFGTTRWRHGETITFVAFPSDKTVLTACADNTARVWERATGKELHRIQLLPAQAQPPIGGRPGGLIGWNPYGRGGPRVAMSADGKVLAAAVNNNIQLWDLDTGKEIRQLKGPANGVTGLLFAPDGKALAVVGNDRTIHLLKTENGDEIRQIKSAPQKGPARIVLGGGGFDAAGLAFSPDGKVLASAEIEFGQQKTTSYLKLTNLETGNEIRKTEFENGVSSIAYSPDGKILAFGSNNNIILSNPETGKEIRKLDNGAGGVSTLTFSPDGKTVAAKGRDNKVRVWNADTGKKLHELGEAVAMQAGGNVFFIANAFGGGETRDIAFSRDSKTIGAADGQTPRFFDVGTGKEQPLAGGHRAGVTTVALAPDGKTMVSRGNDGVVRRWNAKTGETLGQFNEPAGTIAAAIAPDGKTIALANGDGTIRLHAVETGKELHSVKGHPNGTAALAFSADSKTLASRGSNDDTIRLFDVARGGETRSITIPSEVANMNPGGGFGRVGGPVVGQGLAFSPDGSSIAASISGGFQQAMNVNGKIQVVTPAGMIRIWDVGTGKEARQIKLPQNRAINCIAYSPDGRLLAAENSDRTISLWEIASGKERAVLGQPGPVDPQMGVTTGIFIVGMPGAVRTPVSAVPGIAFSADGELLVSRAAGNAVRVWEVDVAKEIGLLKGHTGEVAVVGFAHDGKSAVSGSGDTTILAWDIARLKREPKAEAIALNEEQVKAIWADLSGGDAIKAGQSMRTLTASAKSALPFLRDQVKPVPAIDPKKIDQMITDLDSGVFQKRAKAADELEKLAELAKPAFKKVLDSDPSPETRRRVEQLMEKLVAGSLSSDQLRLVRVVESLEKSGRPEALQLLETLAHGAPGALPTREAQAAVNRMQKQP